MSEPEVKKSLATNGDDLTDSSVISDKNKKLEVIKTNGSCEKSSGGQAGDSSADDALVAKVPLSEDEKRAYSLFAEGSKYLLTHDYSSAITRLGECCRMLASIHGDLASECGKPYYSYGIACLELAKQENNTASEEEEKSNDGEENETPSSDESEDIDDEEEDVKAAEEGVEPIEEVVAAAKVVQATEEIVKKDIVEKTEEGVETKNGHEGETSQDSKNNNHDDELNELDEEVDTLQLAWESFEVARKIFERDQDFTKMVNVYLKLSEVSILSGNYEMAINDLLSTMDFVKDHQLISEQILHEVYYQLAVAYNFNHQFDEAIKYGELALKLVERNVSSMHGKPEKQAELLELQGFLKVVHDILADIHAAKDVELVKEVADAKVSNGSVSGSTASSSAVSDISHLVRRKNSNKRKRDGEEDSE